jgi:hypothetical protein
MTADVQVLARIGAANFHLRDRAHRDEVCAWLRANGLEPNDIPAGGDACAVEIVLLDAPAIRRVEYRSADGRLQFAADDDRRLVTKVVHSLLRVPLPEHLADPT